AGRFVKETDAAGTGSKHPHTPPRLHTFNGVDKGGSVKPHLFCGFTEAEKKGGVRKGKKFLLVKNGFNKPIPAII
ncbi:hypothetical protein Q2465_24785, partial [Escherichia coli]|nr:hypothetical protein [Escherichia coli]